MNKSRRLWIIGGIVASILALTLYPIARNAWLIHRAQKSFAAGEDRKATLQAAHLYQIAPSYTPALSLLADIAEKNLSREALRWRNAAAQMDPSAKNQIALARTCIFFHELEWADQALQAVKPAERQTKSYIQTVAVLALAMHRSQAAAIFFEKALQLDPGDKDLLLNLSLIRLTLPLPDLQAKARQDLQQLKKDPQFATPALVALLQDALANHSGPEVLVREILALPSLTFSDRLAVFDALTEMHSSDLPDFTADFKKRVVDQPDNIYILSNRLVRMNQATEAQQWLDSLDPKIKSTFPVPMARADSLVSLKNWKALQDQVSHEKWTDAEILRHAYQLRASRELSPASRSETGLSEWQKALRSQKVRPAELYLTANLFWSWGWKSEAEEIWWTIAEQSPNPEMALKTLDQIYREEKNTGKLWRISQIAHQSNPRDKVAQNNYAMLSLILSLDQQNAHALAESLYREQPKNPAFLSTYAFSLYRHGQNKEALRLFATLDPKVLAIPEFAFYYALFLKTDGQDNESARYTKMAEKASLLPEEKALMQ